MGGWGRLGSVYMTVSMDASWRSWLQENLARGCSIESLIESMVGGGFDKDAAAAAVRACLAGEIPDSFGYRYDTCPVSTERVVHAHDREIRSVLRLQRPQLILFDDVLSAEECDEVMELSKDRLRRSTIVDSKTGRVGVINNRTSEGTYFRLCENPLIERLDRRISALMNSPLENGEDLQVLRYGVGGEYQAHFDYFPPDQPGHVAHIARGGQRTATLIVYLNDVEDGGETVFADAGISVAPRKGRAVYFRYFNDRGQLDPATKHAGAPVRAGEKWIMTKWMRRFSYSASP
ncbi:2OG-Fe(II) oxygenase [Nocardia wallacei]|uniref:2OG-Fe(II) oxygenase n=1 Tax=Nocardia wallacei TaxID=480035 RepID=UPI0018D68547|nr:2OG-Fe(II) oxygenase [Nocardia wallacei]